MVQTLNDFASNLAVGLTQQVWSEQALVMHLNHRLPRQSTKAVGIISTRLLEQFPKSYAPNQKAVAQALQNMQPVVQIWRRAQNTNATLQPHLGEPRFRPIPAFSELQTPELSTSEELADFLGLSMEHLTRFSDVKGLSNRTNNVFAPHYRFHLIPKRSGGDRLIEEPKPILKRLQRRILHGILDGVPPHSHAFGFVAKRNCQLAASKHCAENAVLSFDLQDFFSSIPVARVFGIFRALGYPETVARHLACLTTLVTPHRILAASKSLNSTFLSNRHLPQGAPTSPALANLAAYRLDQRLSGLARATDTTYTRYADDLTFSGDTTQIMSLRTSVPAIIRDTGFSMNPSKTRLALSHQHQRTTGIVVNQHLNMQRRDFDRLKAALHQAAKTRDPAALAQLDGRIAWLETLNPRKGARLRAKLDDIHALPRPPQASK
ncbi:MAG: reverse transcriptase family protein [Paracoccaceae bacterium]